MNEEEFYNYCSSENKVQIYSSSSFTTSCPTHNILTSERKAIWLSQSGLPQSIVLDLSQMERRPKFFKCFGFDCWHDYPSNPSVIELLVSIDAENFITWTVVHSELKGGVQLFNIDPISKKYNYLKICVKETFGASKTYINQVFLFPENLLNTTHKSGSSEQSNCQPKGVKSGGEEERKNFPNTGRFPREGREDVDNGKNFFEDDEELAALDLMEATSGNQKLKPSKTKGQGDFEDFLLIGRRPPKGNIIRDSNSLLHPSGLSANSSSRKENFNNPINKGSEVKLPAAERKSNSRRKNYSDWVGEARPGTVGGSHRLNEQLKDMEQEISGFVHEHKTGDDHSFQLKVEEGRPSSFLIQNSDKLEKNLLFLSNNTRPDAEVSKTTHSDREIKSIKTEMHNWNEHLKKMDKNIGILIDKNKELFEKIEGFKDDIITQVSFTSQRKGLKTHSTSTTTNLHEKHFVSKEEENDPSRRKTNSFGDHDNFHDGRGSTKLREENEKSQETKSKFEILSDRINRQTNMLLEENKCLKKAIKEPGSNIFTEEFDAKKYMKTEEDVPNLSGSREPQIENKIGDILSKNMKQMQKIIVNSMNQTKIELEKKLSKKLESLEKERKSGTSKVPNKHNKHMLLDKINRRVWEDDSLGSLDKMNTIKAADKTDHIYNLVEKLQKKLAEREKKLDLLRTFKR